jgi:hypothetical protein
VALGFHPTRARVGSHLRASDRFTKTAVTAGQHHNDGLRAADREMILDFFPARISPMVFRPQATWYVSFEVTKLRFGKRDWARATETFRSELEAKEFAKHKLAECQNVRAGTLNPHIPKRVISSAQIIQWLEEPSNAETAP